MRRRKRQAVGVGPRGTETGKDTECTLDKDLGLGYAALDLSRVAEGSGPGMPQQPAQ